MIARESVAGSPSSAQPRPSQPKWLDTAVSLRRAGHSWRVIAGTLGAPYKEVCFYVARELAANPPPCAPIREPEPEIWLGGPREPVAFLTPHRPIIYTEPEITHPAPGLYVSR